MRNRYPYFTSMTQEFFCRVLVIPCDDGFQIGTTETLATGIFGDDFILDRHGNAWITQDPMDMITHVLGKEKKTGEVVTVAGKLDTEFLAGATGCAFGRID